MNLSILIATYGADSWRELAERRALPSAQAQYAEVLIGHDSNGTLASARNGLAERATGDWLCFLDGDDELGPGYVGAMQRAYEREGRDDGTPFLLTPAVQQVRKGRRRMPFFFPERDMRLGNWLVIGTLIQRDLFFALGGFRDFMHEDWNLWARCVRAGARIVRVKDAVYVAHWNPDSRFHTLVRDADWNQREHEAARADAWG